RKHEESSAARCRGETGRRAQVPKGPPDQNPLRAQLTANLRNYFLRGLVDIYDNRRRWLLQISKLAGQQLFGSKVPDARMNSAGDNVPRALQIHQPHPRSDHKLLPVAALQRRTRQYDTALSREPFRDGGVDRLQPGFAVSIAQGTSTPHFFNI